MSIHVLDNIILYEGGGERRRWRGEGRRGREKGKGEEGGGGKGEGEGRGRGRGKGRGGGGGGGKEEGEEGEGEREMGEEGSHGMMLSPLRKLATSFIEAWKGSPLHLTTLPSSTRDVLYVTYMYMNNTRYIHTCIYIYTVFK